MVIFSIRARPIPGEQYQPAAIADAGQICRHSATVAVSHHDNLLARIPRRRIVIQRLGRLLHRLQIHPVGAFLRLIVIHREEGSYRFQSILSNIVQFLCVKAATLIEPQIFLGYIRIKNQYIIRIDCYINSTAVKVSNGMRL